MTSISIENDDNGRIGALEISDKEIKTPYYLPNQKEFNSLSNSKFVDKEDYSDFKVGVYSHWLNSTQLYNISKKRASYNNTKSYLKKMIGKMGENCVERKLLHFEFASDVISLDGQALDILFSLQNDVGADVIEIPNKATSIEDYNTAIKKASEWRVAQNSTKALMGIANDGTDIEFLNSKIGIVDCIGADFSKKNPPLLFAIKNMLKPKNIWVHAFNTPRLYREADWSGTLGVLINYYGIDTLSAKVGHPKGSQNFRFIHEGMSDEDKMKESRETKYFNPADYSTKYYEKYADSIKLSDFCDCPICKNNTVKSLLSDFNNINTHTKAHGAISYNKEATTYQAKMRNNESKKYMEDKDYVKKLVNAEA